MKKKTARKTTEAVPQQQCHSAVSVASLDVIPIVETSSGKSLRLRNRLGLNREFRRTPSDRGLISPTKRSTVSSRSK